MRPRRHFGSFMRRGILVAAAAIGAFAATLLSGYLSHVYSYPLDPLIGALGTVVGALGLAFGGYFAYLAIDAYGHLQGLRDDAAKAHDTAAEIERLQSKFRNASDFSYKVADSILSTLNTIITSLPGD